MKTLWNKRKISKPEKLTTLKSTFRVRMEKWKILVKKLSEMWSFLEVSLGNALQSF